MSDIETLRQWRRWLDQGDMTVTFEFTHNGERVRYHVHNARARLEMEFDPQWDPGSQAWVEGHEYIVEFSGSARYAKGEIGVTREVVDGTDTR